ncbi:hypothetical protein H6F90_16635 [Trichocoleus sp. FACHB-591]|uniref:alr0857 family protein n=1 Tax=Trichocoleus sp. FACHB-591 TaxID=2692872 RepID=UPI00168435FA|nr:alr0857 family protein [Trichocoleus sp. FACHB-591]MBD2096731.1 hypothetical protein [Trichocoleus sp. FACHB-591]
MLKLNYTEDGLYMERVMTSPELAIAQRVVLAMRLGQSLQVEPGHASLLLPADVPELEQLELSLRQECRGRVNVIPVDDEFVEVSLNGSWIAESKEAHEGMFLTMLSDRTEFFLYKLWQMSEAHISTPA